ncbi:TRAP transporter substrate-binding protein [Oceanibacterium hippocampi]|uniref:2,3-diketo-L-gulonate-binding periplasmic protein YiaO n=1 Tax=Oceanibacterium hippocampi TaxID=745714 RepID=A0A1Y5TX96_9PROT|nr:TRAP transporter substrate-binding protein [Oceanibacterium hippocampi]SLN75616.1 2,3-diketo-L-gulonate-binding periplasmic protein YiaO precursor [Oceanibacterium hippocampi]
MNLRMLTGLLALAAAINLGSAPASAQEKITLQLGTASAPAWSLGQVIDQVLKPKVAEYSDGRIDIVVHNGGSLCSEHACVEQLGLGQIDIATVSSGNVGAFGTTFDLINLPFVFKDQDAASDILNGWLAEELGKRTVKEMKMHLIALVPVGGFRQIVNTQREVRVPADLAGLKIRVTKSPTEFNLVKAWGAAPVPYDWSSLYEGLQSGVVQGMYLQNTFTAAGKFYEVVSNITTVSAAWSAHPILMSQKRYEALPDWAREAIDKAGADVQREAFRYDIDWQDTVVKAMEGKVAVYDPTEAEMDLWRAGARDAWVAVKGAYDPALARRILAEQGQDKLIADLEAAGAL